MTIHAPLRMSGAINKGSFIAKTRVEYARNVGWFSVTSQWMYMDTKAAWFYDTASYGRGTSPGWGGDSGEKGGDWGTGYQYKTLFDPPTSTPQRPFFISDSGIKVPLMYFSVIHRNLEVHGSGSGGTYYWAQLRTSSSGMSSIKMKISKLDGSSPYTLTFSPDLAKDYWIDGKSNTFGVSVSSSFFNFFFNNRELLYQQL